MWQAVASDPPLNNLVDYGLAGLILAILLWFGWKVLTRAWARQIEAEAEVRRLNQLIQDKYVPALEAATAALHESATSLTISRDRGRP